MAHTCPDCGQCCHCGGDFEDHETGDSENCTHCPEGLPEDDVASSLHAADEAREDPLAIPGFLDRRLQKEKTMTDQEKPSHSQADVAAAVDHAPAPNTRTLEYTPTPEESEKIREQMAMQGILPEGGPNLTPEKVMEMIRDLRAKEAEVTKVANAKKKEIRAAIAVLKAKSKKMIGDL